MDGLIMIQSPLNGQQLLDVIKRNVEFYYSGATDAEEVAIKAYKDLLNRKLLLQKQLEEIEGLLVEARTFDNAFGQHVKIAFAKHPAS